MNNKKNQTFSYAPNNDVNLSIIVLPKRRDKSRLFSISTNNTPSVA
jgi:hypothetical protein